MQENWARKLEMKEKENKHTIYVVQPIWLTSTGESLFHYEFDQDYNRESMVLPLTMSKMNLQENPKSSTLYFLSNPWSQILFDFFSILTRTDARQVNYYRVYISRFSLVCSSSLRLKSYKIYINPQKTQICYNRVTESNFCPIIDYMTSHNRLSHLFQKIIDYVCLID